MGDTKKRFYSKQANVPWWNNSQQYKVESRTWPDNSEMTTTDVLDKWRDLYEQVFPLLLEDNLKRVSPKTPEALAQEAAEYVNESIRQFQIIEEKVAGLETLAEIEL